MLPNTHQFLLKSPLKIKKEKSWILLRDSQKQWALMENGHVRTTQHNTQLRFQGSQPGVVVLLLTLKPHPLQREFVFRGLQHDQNSEKEISKSQQYLVAALPSRAARPGVSVLAELTWPRCPPAASSTPSLFSAGALPSS